MRSSRTCGHAIWAMVVLTMLVATADARDEPLMIVSAQAEFGPDRGQSLGSLFEATTADGSLVIGAGFCDVYNTHVRMDRRVLQFFVRSADGERQFTMEPLPRPWTATGAYMFNLGDRIVAISGSGATTARLWDPATHSWSALQGRAPERVRIADGELATGEGRFYYDGRVILDAPERGSYQKFYYAEGHLFFYHVDRGQEGYRPWESDDDGFSKLYACPWEPSSGAPVDLSRAVVETLPIVGETTFSWGQHDGMVLTGSNIGGLYVFDDDAWRTVLAPTLNESFQVYTMVQYHDRLLLGQYPTGELFSFEGDRLERLEGWPPRVEGVSPSARECQTSMVWAGDLIVGVWPWGELWRHDEGAGRWYSMGRLFSHPEVHEEPIHPYETEAQEQGIVLNQWGQRVTSMVPFGDSLLISTATKSPFEPDPEPEFMTAEELAEYGRVWRLRLPGCLSAPIHWTSEPTRFEFVITAGEMQIRQNDLPLATAPLAPELARQIADSGPPVDPEWGSGAWGPFGGVAVTGTVSARPEPRE